ncbi:39S ribosomal protein L49, mitochondrial [Esox lucius]|uniref:Large ribosomal subunit protein mL49 n=1 Tax=Esox lucius TaxID=8010 RepID=C1BX77_ESOLU|nr:39S ribosomal protein L49, mitochondrial [Esox lucius]ACO13630.1 Mitochondrial 39S ribosomal protein L49 [Esox lucius]
MSLSYIHRFTMLYRGFRATVHLYNHTARIPNTTIRLQSLCTPVGEANAKIIQSTEEYKFVERLIPPSRVPIPPKRDGPAPSGWTPPAEMPPALPYMIRRSRMHNIPVYTDLTHGSRKTTIIRKVEGDIWALEKDVKEFLQQLTGKDLPTQVNEVTMILRVKGHFDVELKEWLVKKGF